MDLATNWFVENWKLLFSGVGGTLIVFVLGLIVRRRSNSTSQDISSGSGSTNLQAGGDVNLTVQAGDKNVEENQ